MVPRVLAVACNPTHSFSKWTCHRIHLLEGRGVEGDVHCGEEVKHRSRVAQVPIPPNLRQVHLIHSELFEELAERGFIVEPGQIGENITTRGIDLLSLPTDTELSIGPAAIIRVTGLRNPCSQLDNFQPGLMSAVLGRSLDGNVIRKSGIMAVVVASGHVSPGHSINVKLPEQPHRTLDCV